MLLSDLLDIDQLRVEVRRKFVSVREHPLDPGLRIFNYTHEAAFEGSWTHEQRICRGLIVRFDIPNVQDAHVVARPFPKFFNYGEHLLNHETIPLDEPFEVATKEDGSLGILYPAPDGLAIATRGSFGSDQAMWATEHLRATLPSYGIAYGNLTRLFEMNATVLFEIVAPWNRIVIDYGSFEGLVLLAVLDNETGRPLDLQALQEQVASHDGREHASRSEDRMEEVSSLSQRQSQARSSEARREASANYPRLAEDSSSSVEGVGQEELRQDPSLYRRSEGSAVHGLSSDIPILRDGLRPSGPDDEGLECGSVSQSEEDDSRDREVRPGVRQLPPHQNLGFWSGPVVETHSFYDLEDLLGYMLDAPAENREGFVIYFPESDLRVKVKFEEYVKLHRILTGLSERRIWEHISQGGSIEDFIEGVPDEFFDWVRAVDNRLRMQHDLAMVGLEGKADLLHEMGFESRKDLAIALQGEPDKGYLFRAYDGQWDRLSEAVWRDLKPAGNITFRQDDDS